MPPEEDEDVTTEEPDIDELVQTHNFQSAERDEYETIQQIEERIKNGESVPQEIVDIINSMKAINYEQLFGTIEHDRLHTHVLGIVPGVKRFIIETDEIAIEVRFTESDDHVNAVFITYPIEDGNRLWVGRMTGTGEDNQNDAIFL